jgi:hypothetical protein
VPSKKIKGRRRWRRTWRSKRRRGREGQRGGEAADTKAVGISGLYYTIKYL